MAETPRRIHVGIEIDEQDVTAAVLRAIERGVRSVLSEMTDDAARRALQDTAREMGQR